MASRSKYPHQICFRGSDEHLLRIGVICEELEAASKEPQGLADGLRAILDDPAIVERAKVAAAKAKRRAKK